MATLLRAAVSATRGVSLLKSQPMQICRTISTSKKNKDIATATTEKAEDAESEEYKRLVKHFSNADPYDEKNQMTYGFSKFDTDYDLFSRHMAMFTGVTMALVLTGFIIKYYPDNKGLQWANREAFLQIAQREREGLPLLNPNYVDPSTVELPSEEELKDMTIRL